MKPIYNFSAGPAILPAAVIQQAQEEMRDWRGAGMSVMEMSHRSKAFIAMAQQAEADIRDLMAIPDHYRVLFLQGGASTQFAAVPLNLFNATKNQADYYLTGAWSKKAIAEAKRYGQIHVVADTSAQKFTTLPAPGSVKVSPDAAYVHYTPNETIQGVEFHTIPDTGDVPLVADMSSNILSRPIDVSQFGIIYAGAQKNIGPAGLTLVIIRDDLIGKAAENVPAMLNYATHVKAGSMYNTPPTYAWYIAGLVFQWLKAQGGLPRMAEINQRKAAALYAAIDQSDFYHNPVEPAYRSWMNVPFTLTDDALDAPFLQQASDHGLETLKGHRSIGGMRASIYNAMPEAGVQALIEFMSEFERTHG